MRKGFLITARLKSTRLEKKLLLNVLGENYITWMIRRLKLAPQLDEIVLCTSTNEQDNPLEEIAIKENIKIFRGSEEDVAERLYLASQKFNLDYFINMTADCPFVPYELIPDVLSCYERTNADLIKCYDMPEGMFLSGVKPSAMRRVLELKLSNHTEYWLFVFLKSNQFKVENLNIDTSLIRPKYRFVLDYPEDHEFLNMLYEGLGANAYELKSDEIIKWLDKTPELAKTNFLCREKGKNRTLNDPTSTIKLKNQ